MKPAENTVVYLFAVSLVARVCTQDARGFRHSGTNAVLQAIALIQGSGIFPDDHEMLRRVAWVESKDGNELR